MRLRLFILGSIFAAAAFAQAPASQLPLPRWMPLDNNSRPVPGGKLCFYQTGTFTPQAVYSNSAANVPLLNPVILDSAGRANVWFGNGLSYRVVFQQPGDNYCPGTGASIWTQDNVSNIAQITLANLASSSGAGLVGYNLGVSGARTTTVGTKLNSFYEAVADFGADPTGTIVSNAVIQVMATASHASGLCGHVKGGTYKLQSASATIALTGNVCLYGDGQNKTVFQENSSGAISFSVTGQYNSISHLSIGPVAGSGSTAFFDGGASVLSGNNKYEDIFCGDQSNSYWFNYCIEVSSSSGYDDDLGYIINSRLSNSSGTSGAAIYLNSAYAGRAVNAWHITGNIIQGGSGIGVLCDGCGENTVDANEFEGLGTGFKTLSTHNAALYNWITHSTGENNTYWFVIDVNAVSNYFELIAPAYAGTAALYTDASGGANTIFYNSATHFEDLGSTALAPRFGIGAFTQGGGAKANMQANTQIEIRPSWSGSYTISYPNLICMPMNATNTGCGLWSLTPGAGGAGWLFSTLNGFNSTTVATFDNSGASENSTFVGYTYGGSNLLGKTGFAYNYPDYDYYSVHVYNPADTEVQRFYGDGSTQDTLAHTGSLPTCNSGSLGRKYFITDATSVVFNAVVAGGGSSGAVWALCDGTNWRVH